MMFGDKTTSWFDLWSLDHFLSGVGLVLIAQFVMSRAVPQLYRSEQVTTRDRRVLVLFIAGLLAYMWEAVEFYLEAGYTHNDAITYWFQGVEFWGNRLIADPILTVGGAWFGLCRRRTVIWARLVSVVWLVVHVFLLPHSMSLQDWLVSSVKGS